MASLAISSLDSLLYNIWHKLWLLPVDYSLSYFVQTTAEKATGGGTASSEYDNSTLFKFYKLFNFLLWTQLAILMTPIGITVGIIWYIVFRQVLRRESFVIESNGTLDHIESSGEQRFEIMSANICLLPECLSKTNNLHSVYTRLDSMANILTKSTSSNTCCHLSQSQSLIKKFKSEPKVNKELDAAAGFKVQIVDEYASQNDPDFICLQEVWSLDVNRRIKSLLSKKFYHFCYDVDSASVYRLLGSGLFIASKYPIVRAEFKEFNLKVGKCALTGKGVLIVKVQLGKSAESKTKIGFITNTHLQSYQGTEDVHRHQLNEIQNWTKSFKQRNHDAQREQVLFDVICGDFNFDNMSPVDKNAYEHAIFKEYVDPMALEPGKDHPGAIGTEMRFYALYDVHTSSPKLFKKCLENDRVRRYLIVDGDIEFCSAEMCEKVPEIAEDGLPVSLNERSGNRRVDRIMYSNEHKIQIEEFNFITTLTRLTDHIPISMKFKC